MKVTTFRPHLHQQIALQMPVAVIDEEGDFQFSVNEVTISYTDLIFTFVKSGFPNATITIDVFNIIKNQCALYELRTRNYAMQWQRFTKKGRISSTLPSCH